MNDTPFRPLRIAILSISDTRTLETDKSGKVLAELIEGAGHIVHDRVMSRDDRAGIADRLRAWADDPAVEVVLSTGGTGLTGRDVTVEAHRDVYEKEIEAFASVFAMVSMRTVGTSAIQSRATGGIANGTYMFALPGSSGAVRDAWTEILVHQFDSTNGPCNLVEILPRLTEGR